MRFRHRLKSSSLFYAVTFVLLVGTLMSGMVLLAHMRSVQTERYIAQGRVVDNARSAVGHALGTLLADGAVHHLDLYGEGTDSIAVQSIPYGALDLVMGEAQKLV